MRKLLKKIAYRLRDSRLSVLAKPILDGVLIFQYMILTVWWCLSGKKLPNEEERQLVCENVTFMFKSFERQYMARRLYRCIQRYYPGARVVVADDSQIPLEIQDEPLTLLHLPFNSGLSAGLNRALAEVKTPFVFRMDDDELLTPFTQVGKQLQLLMENPQIDIVGIQACRLPIFARPKRNAAVFVKQSMEGAPKQLLIPHMTKIDDTHYVVGKCANIFLARTGKLREVGYDDNIRMIDHNEFFYRAAGVLVTTMDMSAWIFHYHNLFDRNYNKYRKDIAGDVRYIRAKHAGRR